MKKAIVIGNYEYANIDTLPNALNDAKDIANILSKHGFDVDLYEDLSFETFLKITQDKKKLESISEIFFYFAGHAMQFLDRNYLLPVDISKDLTAPYVLENHAIYLGDIVNLLQTIDGKKIIVLDSCRNHNIQNEIINNDDLFNKGLVEIEAADNLLIAYATKSGFGAFEKHPESNNGLYTGTLKKYLKQYRLSINEVFEKTRNEVVQISNYKQIPWESSSLRSNYQLSTLDLSKPIFNINVNFNDIEVICTSSENLIITTEKSITFLDLQEDYIDITKTQGVIVKRAPRRTPIIRNFTLDGEDYIEKCQSNFNGIFYAASTQGKVYKIESQSILDCEKNIGTPVPTIKYMPEIIFDNKNNNPFYAIDISDKLIVCADSNNVLYIININTETEINQIGLSEKCSTIVDLKVINSEVYLATSDGLMILDMKTLNIETPLKTLVDAFYYDQKESKLFIAAYDNKIIIYNINSKEYKEVELNKILNSRVNSIKCIKSRFIILGTDSSSIILYDLDLNELVDEYKLNDESRIYSLDVMSDNILVARKNANEIGFWELNI